MSPVVASMFLYDSFYVVDQIGFSSGEIRYIIKQAFLFLGCSKQNTDSG